MTDQSHSEEKGASPGFEIQRRFVRGSLILFAGNFASTANNAAAVILIARLLGPSQYGLYTLALVLPGLLQVFVGLGVNLSVVRFVAFSLSQGRPDDARRFALSATLFLTLFGWGLAALNYAVAGTLSVGYFHRPELTTYAQEASLSILGSAVLQAGTASAIGWNRMGVASLAQVAQAVVKLGAAPLLILGGLGVTGAVAGHVASLLAAGLLVVALVYWAGLARPEKGASAFLDDVRGMVRFGLPLYLGNLASSMMVYYTTFVLAAIASNQVVGYYQAAFNFTAIVGLVSVAMANALFPAFATIDGKGGNPAPVLRYAGKFVAFFVAPATTFLILTSGLLLRTFYGAQFEPGTMYLQLLAVSNLPVVFGYGVFPVFFGGFGKPKLTMYTYAAGAATLFFLAPVLSTFLQLGVDGLIYALALSYVVSTATGTMLARKRLHSGLDARATVAIFFSSVGALAGTLFLPLSRLSDLLGLAVAALVFLALYLTLVPLTHGVDDSDLLILERSLEGARVVGRVASGVARYMRFVLSVTRR